MKATLTTPLDRWATDELVAEVLRRSAEDRPALDRLQATIMRARLDDCDRKADTETGTRSGHWHVEATALV